MVRPLLTRSKEALKLVGDPADLFVPDQDYALKPWPIGFLNSQAALNKLLARHIDNETLDVTAFYSRRRDCLKPHLESVLADVDKEAWAAAKTLGGLVVYYRGQVINTDDKLPDSSLNLDFTPDCMSFCIWKSREQAVASLGLKAHRQATALASQCYAGFSIVKYSLLVRKYEGTTCSIQPD
jgi:hypothetical protein